MSSRASNNYSPAVFRKFASSCFSELLRHPVPLKPYNEQGILITGNSLIITLGKRQQNWEEMDRKHPEEQQQTLRSLSEGVVGGAYLAEVVTLERALSTH